MTILDGDIHSTMHSAAG